MSKNDKTINIAIIGCGDMGRMHSDCLAQMESVRLLWFCDTDLAQAASLAQRYPESRPTASAEDVFADPRVHAVYIATQTDSHLQLCLAAARARKPILVEKPVTLCSTGTLEVMRAFQQAQLPAMVGFKFRFYSLVHCARALVSAPYSIHVQVMDDPWPPDFWANDIAKGGGNVISQGIHGADLLRFLSGSEPRSVFAVGKNYHQPTGVIDHLSAVYRFANDAAGTLIVGDSGQPPGLGKFLVQLFGREGVVVLSDRLTRLAFHPVGREEVQYRQGEEDGFINENRAFIQLVRGYAAPDSSLYEGFLSQLMIDAALASAQSRQVESLASRHE
ncbi:MAG TPA: Gfo/Idh/MocA family oxidoreductase [bacterium]|nr:Gfo/Idh/MocA family oxidoreductase [bacterium]HPN34339.1 Gfo/Idh/MocA family oxidoreductase [bacterium]